MFCRPRCSYSCQQYCSALMLHLIQAQQYSSILLTATIKVKSTTLFDPVPRQARNFLLRKTRVISLFPTAIVYPNLAMAERQLAFFTDVRNNILCDNRRQLNCASLHTHTNYCTLRTIYLFRSEVNSSSPRRRAPN